MKKLLLPFLFLGLLLNACKKDNSVALKPSENPVSSLLTETDWKLTTYPSGNYELGNV